MEAFMNLHLFRILSFFPFPICRGWNIEFLAAYKLPKRDRVSRKENILVFDAAADGTLMEVQFLGDFLNRQRNGGWDLPQEVFFLSVQNKTNHFDQGRFSSLQILLHPYDSMILIF